VTFGHPDAIVALPEAERAERVTMAGRNFAQLDGKRFFIRVLLPVQLDIGHEYRFGVWIEVSEGDCKHVWKIWDTPDYAEAEVEGMLANIVPPWGDRLAGAACHASARNRDDVLYIDRSTHRELEQVLTTPWPVHECRQLIEEVWGS
jgi:hypothetical protein